MSDQEVLSVFLSGEQIGRLTRLPSDRMLFNFSENYINSMDRPVLSQSFFDASGQLIPASNITQTRAPAFFSNLLPEGHLRIYLAKKAGIKSVREFGLLHLLGHDLPGAVTLRPDKNVQVPAGGDYSVIEKDLKNKNILKFSLAGVQLKFSAVLQATSGLTIPAHGENGSWIVKLPSLHFRHVPENEYAMLSLAKAIGIEVPDIQLIETSQILNLPDIPSSDDKFSLAIKRFDRNNGKRIHIEDFAQIYHQYPERKYDSVSYNNITNMLSSVIGEQGVAEFIKRLVFNMLIGNGDMHLKNWSLIYNNKQKPSLSPAYDYLATQIFIENDQLALNFMGTKQFSKINKLLFKQFAKKCQLPERWVLTIVSETVASTLQAWQNLKSGLPLKNSIAKKIETHLFELAKQLEGAL